jgi:hypothetical protein
MASIYQSSMTELAKKNQIQPVTQDFEEDKGVAGRINTLTSTSQVAPLMKTAQTQAKQAAASRGLMNSSLGVQAGQQAVINSALPIAQADASLYQQQSLTNQNARNAAGTQNASNAIAAGTRGLELDAQEGQFGRSLMEQARQFDTNQTLTRDMFGSDDSFRKAQLAQQQQQFGVTSGQSQQQIDAQRDQFAAGQQLTREMFSTDDAFRNAQLAQQQGQFDATQRANLGMFDRELAQKAEQFGLSQAQQIMLANMDVDSKLKLAEVEAQFKNEIQSSANISNAWGTVMQGIAQIQGNPELDANAKNTLIQNNLDSFKAFSAFWNKSTGVDVSDLLNFGMTPGGDGTGGQAGGGQQPNVPGEPNLFPNYPGWQETTGGA